MYGQLWIGLAVVALFAGCLLSCLAQSLREISRARLEEIATIRKKHGAAARIAAILDDTEGHFASVAYPRVVCNLLVMLGVVLWVRDLRQGRDSQSWWVEVSIGFALASVLLWIFGVVLPAAVAKHAAEATVYAWSPVLRVAHVVLKPFQFLPRVIDEAVRRLAGKTEQDENKAIEQELLSVVDEANQDGTFDDTERDMIEAVVKFRNRTVAQVMTPRTEMEAISVHDDLSKVTAMIRTIGHSRIPVYEGDIDHVVGIFYVKDLMKWLAGEGSRSGKPFVLRSLLRPAVFVPETKTIRELLTELLGKRVHIAMVADEYGGTAGLVTIEDIVEEVFGDIQDEYEEPEHASAEVVIDAGRRHAEIDARAYIVDVNAALRELDIVLPESEDYDTVGGFVTVSLGHIPAVGEEFSHGSGSGGLQVRVLASEPTRVTRVRVAALTSSLDGMSGQGVTDGHGGHAEEVGLVQSSQTVRRSHDIAAA